MTRGFSNIFFCFVCSFIKKYFRFIIIGCRAPEAVPIYFSLSAHKSQEDFGFWRINWFLSGKSIDNDTENIYNKANAKFAAGKEDEYVSIQIG